jgi:two-component system, chemotaxis family, protein-glutamate methylesterase/glutaminase
MKRYRRHVGHAYSHASLLAGQDESLEAALWNAVRVLEERVKMLDKMAADAERQGFKKSSGVYRERSGESREQMELIRNLLLRLRPVKEREKVGKV